MLNCILKQREEEALVEQKVKVLNLAKRFFILNKEQVLVDKTGYSFYCSNRKCEQLFKS